MVEHHVDIGCADRIDLLNVLVIDQMLGRDQHFAFFEHQSGLLVGDQNPVVGRDFHVTLWQTTSQCTLADQDRPQMRVLHQQATIHSLVANPPDLLRAVVAGDDLVAELQLFDQFFALLRQDQRARRKAGDNGFDFLKDNRIAVIEVNDAILVVRAGVFDEIDIIGVHDQRVKVITARTTVDHVACTGDKGIAIITAIHDIVAFGPDQKVVTRATDQRVIAVATIKLIVTGTTFQMVFAAAAYDDVIAVAAFETIVAFFAVKNVVTVFAKNSVVSGAAVDCVVTLTTG